MMMMIMTVLVVVVVMAVMMMLMMEEHAARGQLGQDAVRRPHVHRQAVLPLWMRRDFMMMMMMMTITKPRLCATSL
jgi:quinol-cytochrome oxidoreductase complex cytochrome b subunit